MDSEKEKTIERIKKFKESKLIKKIVLTGALVGATFGTAKANGTDASGTINKSDTIKNKIEVKTAAKSAISPKQDEKTFKADFSEKADTLSVREYNEQSIEKADAAVKVLIAMTEDFRNETYLCAAKVRTFGYGITNIGRPLRKTDSIEKFTEITDDMDETQRRDAILSKGMEYVSEYLAKHVYPVILDNVNVKLEPNQVAAVSSLIYNIGKGNFLGYTKKNGKVVSPSPVFEAINKGVKGEELGKAFMKHIYAAGRPIKGLAARRYFELNMYIRPEFMTVFPELRIGAPYLKNINAYFKEDISTKERFALATSRGRLTPKTDDATIKQFIEDIKSAKPEMKEVFHILPQDTINAFNKTIQVRVFDNAPAPMPKQKVAARARD